MSLMLSQKTSGALNEKQEVLIMNCNNGMGSCWWIIILILLISCCGCGNGTMLSSGNGCGCNNGCGCDNGCGC